MKLFYAVAFLCFFNASVPFVSGVLTQEKDHIKPQLHYSFLYDAVKRVLQAEEFCCCNNDTNNNDTEEDDSTDELEEDDDDDETTDDPTIGNDDETTDDPTIGNDEDEVTEDPTPAPSSSESPTPISREQLLGSVMQIIFDGLGATGTHSTNYCNWPAVVNCNGIEPTRITESDSILDGTLSTEIGYLTELTKLELSRNFITGSIPTELGLLTDLVVFDLDYNYLTGSIPDEVENLTSLTHFLIYNEGGNGSMTGTVPPFLCGIYSLDIGGTGITDTC